MNINILSTLLHFFSIYPLLYKNNIYIYIYIYISVIITSTILSILHHHDETNIFIKIIDYLFALIWFFADIYYCSHENLSKVILLNFLSFIINLFANKKYHAYWHLINAAKCFYISNL
jgi:hypothetical protein